MTCVTRMDTLNVHLLLVLLHVVVGDNFPSTNAETWGNVEKRIVCSNVLDVRLAICYKLKIDTTNELVNFITFLDADGLQLMTANVKFLEIPTNSRYYFEATSCKLSCLVYQKSVECFVV